MSAQQSLKLGIIGLRRGLRQANMLKEDAGGFHEIRAVCDLYQNKVDDAVKKLNLLSSQGYTDYRVMLQDKEIETTVPATHNDPTYVVDKVIHYSVANMPGEVPRTSTIALTNATLPYVIQLAAKGWKKVCAEDKTLRKGLNVVDGKVVYKSVAEAFGLPYHEVNKLIGV